jgi:hypothetical protein
LIAPDLVGVWIKIENSVECNAIVNGYVFLELARAASAAQECMHSVDRTAALA